MSKFIKNDDFPRWINIDHIVAFEVDTVGDEYCILAYLSSEDVEQSEGHIVFSAATKEECIRRMEWMNANDFKS